MGSHPLEPVQSRGRQRYGNTEYRSAVYRFFGSRIENFCGTVLRYKFLELAVNGIGSGTDFRKNGISNGKGIAFFSKNTAFFCKYRKCRLS